MDKVIFKYKPETTVQTLLRHHRIARWIIYPCGFFALFMLSSVAHGVMTRFDWITIVMTIASVCVVAVLVIPACFCFPWMHDIETELNKRGAPIPGGQDINRRIRRTTIKMMLCAIVIVAGPPLIRKLMEIIAHRQETSSLKLQVSGGTFAP